MSISNTLKHIWKKVYFNLDLPPDRTTPCQLKTHKVLLEFFLPTTKRKESISTWLGINNEIYLNDLKATLKTIFIIVADTVLFIPRLAANILKIITEVFPLSLRELAYACFKSMLEGARETEGLPKKLYQAAALICWFFTALFSCIYFVGCLLTSPGRTIPAIVETFNKLEWPGLGIVLAVACSVLVVCFHAALFMTGLWFTFPSVALTILNSGWISALATSLLIVIDGFGGLIFNTNPDQPNLTVEFAEEEEDKSHQAKYNSAQYDVSSIATWKLLQLSSESIMKDTNISIPPDEFIKIFNDDYTPVKVNAGNNPPKIEYVELN